MQSFTDGILIPPDPVPTRSPIQNVKCLLVTGGHGFVGKWIQRLAPAIRDRHGYQVAVTPAGFEILEPPQLDRVLAQHRPDAILHLAAQSNVPQSFRDPEATIRVNLIGTLRLFEAVKRAGLSPRVVYVSSGDVYGQIPETELPVREDRILHPRNPYAVSKLCCQWSRTENLQVVVARPFNHVGAGQADTFVLPGFARQIALIAAGRAAPVVEVGDIDVTRDFLHVTDVIEAYMVLIEKAQAGGIYNVCSGHGRLLRDLLERMVRLADVQAEIRQDPARFRPAEQRVVRGCNDRLRALGWAPSDRMDEALAEILADWQSRVATG